MMTGDRPGVDHDPGRHAAYVGAWIKTPKEDPHEVYRASRDAQAMSDYLLERGHERNPEREGHAIRAAPPRNGPSRSGHPRRNACRCSNRSVASSPRRARTLSDASLRRTHGLHVCSDPPDRGPCRYRHSLAFQ